MLIIGISGKAQHGKDTVAGFLKEGFESKGLKVLNVAFADYLKFAAQKYFDWNGEKDEKGRETLQKVGTNFLRKNNPDIFVNIVKEFLKGLGEDGTYNVVTISDVRFPNEISLLTVGSFPTAFIRVNRPNFDNGLNEEQQKHPSETALDNLDVFDIYIENDGTLDDLKEKINSIISTKFI